MKQAVGYLLSTLRDGKKQNKHSPLPCGIYISMRGKN